MALDVRTSTYKFWSNTTQSITCAKEKWILNLKTHEISLRNWLKKPKININMPSRISRSPLTLWIRTPKISIKPVRIDQELYNKGQKKLYVFVFSKYKET